MTLGPDLGVAGASTDGIYAAMDWLTACQDDIEKQLAARHLHRRRAMPIRRAVSSPRCCPRPYELHAAFTR